MSIYIPGGTGTNQPRFDWDANGPYISFGTRPTAGAAIFRVIPKNVVAMSGDTAIRIAGCNNDANSDFALGVGVGTGGASVLTARLRTNVTNSYGSPNITMVADEPIYFGIWYDYPSRQLKFFGEAGQLGETITLLDTDTWRGSSFRPFMRGRLADLKDVEFVEVAYWHNANDLAGDVATYVPTDTQMAAYTPGASIASWPTPKSHVIPTGTNGQLVTTFPDLAPGGRVFNLTQSGGGIYAPYYVSEEIADIQAGAIDGLSSQSANFNYVSLVDGTLHTIIGPSANNASAPTPAQLKLGQNQDGSSATADIHSAITGDPSPDVFSFAGVLSPSVTYRVYATVETDTDVFTDVISWEFTTPRIGLRTDALYTPGATPALWTNQAAIEVAVATDGWSSVIMFGETDAAGVLSVDLSAVEGYYPEVGNVSKLGWAKGDYSGYMSLNIVDLDV